MGYTLATKQYLDDIMQANSVKQIHSLFDNCCKEFNLETYALAILSEKKNSLEYFSIYHTYPREWINRYKEKKYYRYDPVFSNLKKFAFPFEWNCEQFDTTTHIQKKFVEEAIDFGVKKGLTIPLIPNYSFQGFLTLLHQPSIHPDILYSLSLVGNVSVRKIMTLETQKCQANKHGTKS